VNDASEERTGQINYSEAYQIRIDFLLYAINESGIQQAERAFRDASHVRADSGGLNRLPTPIRRTLPRETPG
jgi:hypothetical protein